MQAPNDQAAAHEYNQHIKYTIGILTQRAMSLNMKIDVLSNGKSAYQINNRDRKSIVSRTSDWIDRNPRKALFASISLTALTGGVL